jgi:Tfp pilus assembly protein PilO
MATWSQKKQLLTIGSVAACLCLSAFGGVYYAHGLIDDIQVEVEAKKQSIAAAEAKIAQIPGLEKEVIILRENLDEYVKILPDTRELNDFVRMVDQFERQSGVEGTGLIPKATRAGKGAERFVPIEYTYEMTATLWQFLKFLNLVESYERFVAVSDFSIVAGGDGKDDELRDGDVVHTVKMTLQTYTYNGKAAGKEVEIADYAALRESLREEIFKRMQAIRIDRYEHRGQQGRRDVLVDPRERGDLAVDGPSAAEQRAVLERYVGEVTNLRDVMQRMRRQDTTLFEQYALEKALRDGLAKLGKEIETDATKVTYAPYRLRWAREVVGPVDEIRDQFERVGKADQTRDPYLAKPELEQLVADMRADLKAGQLEEAKGRYETVVDRLGVPAEDARHDLVVAAKALQVKASTALDFRGMDIKVQGVVVNRDGRSGVLLNGEVYEEGEYVSDELLVKLVEEEQIWFVFRGLTLVRTM